MSEDVVYLLDSVSVVVTAEFHNPSILSTNFLVSNGIVPSDWVTTEAITTPQVTLLRYENGIEWMVDQSVLNVTQHCGTGFGDHYEVYDIVRSYLEHLPHVPYRSLGLNSVASMGQDEPQQWLTKRFLKTGNWLEGQPKVIGMTATFTVEAGDAVCNLTFSPGQLGSEEGEPRDAVIINSNVHHAGPLDANELRAAISRWPERQEMVLSAFDKLLKSDQT